MSRHTNIVASYLMLIRDDQILLLRRCNTGYEDGNYSLIAGHVDEGESFTSCMIREAQEEAGIQIKPEDLEVKHILHRYTGPGDERVEAFFVAKSWLGELQNKEPHKCDDLSWFSIDSLPTNTIDYIRHVIEHFREGSSYSEYGWGS